MTYKRISDAVALDLFQTADLPMLRETVTAAKLRLHPTPESQATYLIMRIVSLTNVCVADCAYCAFYRHLGDKDAYVLTHDQVFAKVDELVERGGTMVAMEGGFHPKLKVEHYEDLFCAMRGRYGDQIEIYGPTIVEAIWIAKSSKIALEDCLRRLMAAGLRWIPGGGAEILADKWRQKLSPNKYSVADYINGMRCAQKLGMGTTATMVIGFGEPYEARVEHLRHIRKLQDETGGFTSFLCWTYQSVHTALGGAVTSNEDYLRTMAIARLYLDNIPHIRTSILTQGSCGPEALLYGANDFDIPLEDQVTQLAGATIEDNIDCVLGWVRTCGLIPRQRSPFAIATMRA
jgi:cyclic dehypoxanthinyl futalosine synthase